MKRKAEQMQAEIEALEVRGESGGGMVKVTMTGRFDVRHVDIDADILSDKGMLEDLVASAMNDAVRKVEAMKKEKLAGLTDGLGLPPGLSLPGGLDKLF